MLNEIDNIPLDPNLWIIGWILNSKKTNPDFYIIFIPGEKDVPLMIDRKILLFTKDSLIEFLSFRSIRYDDVSKERELVCDIETAINLINNSTTDTDSTILNVLNFLMDGVNSLATKLPKKNKNILHRLADHLTFSKTFENFFREQHGRSIVEESIYLLIGIIITNSTFWENEE